MVSANDSVDGKLAAGKSGVLARKFAAMRAVQDIAPMDAMADFSQPMALAADPAERAWRISLARAARDHMKMALGFESLNLDQVGLAEVLETSMERALILVLEGAGDALGLLVISPPILSGMIEMLTLSRLAPDASDDGGRSPTRTDAAMVVDMIDAALASFAESMAHDPAWSQPYRYAAFIEDPRPLHLMLDDGDYRILRANVHLEHGGRMGAMVLAVPAQETMDFAPPPSFDSFPIDPGPDFDDFNADFADQIAAVPAHLDAVLAQISLPLDRVLRLQVGEVLALSGAALDAIRLQGVDGLAIGGGKLGQNRGMRAVRLVDVPQVARSKTTHGAPSQSESDDVAQPDMGANDMGVDYLQTG